jgi:hypothetical protein
MKCGSVQAGGGPIYHNTQFSHGYKPYQKPAYSTPPQFNLPNPGIHCANDFAQYKEPLIGKGINRHLRRISKTTSHALNNHDVCGFFRFEFFRTILTN